MTNAPPDNGFQIHCPKLGHQIYFAYCCSENWGKPCLKTLDCWHIYFPVETYLRQKLTQKEWEDLFQKPATPKIVSLVELIDTCRDKKSSGTE